MAVGVTGATGVLGGLVARGLADRGVTQTLLVRTPDRAPVLPGATVLRCAYAESDETVGAHSGLDTVFMVSAAESADRLEQHRSFITAARRAGVRQIVYTSFVGAAPDATFTLARDHHATEEFIKASGCGYTFLRDNFYIDFMTDLVGEDGVIRGPAGDGKAAVVARADIARAAQEVLEAPQSHRNRTYQMTGPEALSMADVARIITETTGDATSFHNEGMAEAYESRRGYGAPDWQVEAWVSTYTAIASGELAAVSRDIEDLTGTPPMTLADFLRERGQVPQ